MFTELWFYRFFHSSLKEAFYYIHPECLLALIYFLHACTQTCTVVKLDAFLLYTSYHGSCVQAFSLEEVVFCFVL